MRKFLRLISTLLILDSPAAALAQDYASPPSGFNVQMPAPTTPPQQSSALPTGLVPQQAQSPSPGYPAPTYAPSQQQTGYVPMALPPSSGGFNSGGIQNSNYGNTYNQSPQQSQPAAPTKSEVILYNPKAELKTVLIVKTSEGEFKITLKPDIAPKNVENFIDLALGQKEFVDIRTGKKVKRPFYTGLNCHRVLKSVLIQCGCPFGNGTGGPGFRILDERSTAMRFDRPGVVAMALARGPVKDGVGYEPNSAGSQFFISLAPLPEYNGQFTVIGQVTGGMDTLRKIAENPTGPTDRPLKRVIIFSVDPDLPPIVNPVSVPDPSAPTAPLAAPPTSPSAPAIPGLNVDPFAAPPPPPGP